MTPLTVLHVIHNLAREGAQQVLANLAGCGVALGDRHAVLPWHHDGPVRETLTERSVTALVPVRGPHRLRGLRAVAELAAASRRHGADVLHAHMSDGAIIAAAASCLTGVPYVVTHHSNRLMPKVRSPVAHLRRRSFLWAVRGAAANVAVANEVAGTFGKLIPAGEGRLRIIPNGVVVPDEPAVEAARAARAGRRAGPGRPHLVCVGRLVGIKGQDQLIDALPALRARFPDLSLTLAGDGAARPDLEARARRMAVAGAVRFAGVVADVGAILARADLYVSTSHYEGLPMALLEAMAWGVPVVASDVPGNRDAVTGGETGRSYRLNDVSDLVRQVTLALEEPAAETMAAAARRQVVAEHGAEAMARRYRTLYEQVARRREPGARPAELR